MTDYNQLISLTKDYTVLYAEDDETVAASMNNILKTLFRKVYYAVNGKEGLEIFLKNKKHIDIIISDIHMPEMNGLDMTNAIKQDTPSIPVVITTAYSDQEYFIKSIDTGVDKYLIKPIEAEKLFNVLGNICQQIETDKKAKKLQKQEIQNEINSLSEFNITRLIEISLNPIIIYTDDLINYFNSAFGALLEVEELKTFIFGNRPIDSLFLEKKGCTTTLNDDVKQSRGAKVFLKVPSGYKYFTITSADVHFAGNDTASIVYTLYDITWLEYEKNKVKNYSEMLEELVITARRDSNLSKQSKELTSKAEDMVMATIQPSPFNGVIETSEMDKDILRRTRHNAIYSAKEFMNTVDAEIFSQLEELQETENELLYLLDALKDDKKIMTLLDISYQFNLYANVIGELLEFEDLAYAIRSFCKVMDGANKDSLCDDTSFETLSTFMQAFLKDLTSWRLTVFIEQSADDIHYLDSSLLSSCMQIEVLLYNKESIDEAEDLIFF